MVVTYEQLCNVIMENITEKLRIKVKHLKIKSL
jgi:hypothetical protein